MERGRVGTDGQSKTKMFKDAAAAKKEYDKLITEKTGKGYTAIRVSGTFPAGNRS